MRLYECIKRILESQFYPIRFYYLCVISAIDQMIVGCYRDGEDRDLTYGPVESLYMNPGMCIYHCREKGFLYAGLQVRWPRSGLHTHLKC